MLIYDCFEFVPTTLEAFKSDIAAGKDACTEEELMQVEKLLRETLKKRKEQYTYSMGFLMMGAQPNINKKRRRATNHSKIAGAILLKESYAIFLKEVDSRNLAFCASAFSRFNCRCPLCGSGLQTTTRGRYPGSERNASHKETFKMA
jgi:hypothetical protein